mmetsp:Transcript_43841/g.135352  ORF Transcript_43841/g.135352 Transcript_43841/m.135352 type:complete len:282 (-) Transcript_43841:1725-2570(-)
MQMKPSFVASSSVADSQVPSESMRSASVTSLAVAAGWLSAQNVKPLTDAELTEAVPVKKTALLSNAFHDHSVMRPVPTVARAPSHALRPAATFDAKACSRAFLIEASVPPRVMHVKAADAYTAPGAGMNSIRRADVGSYIGATDEPANMANETLRVCDDCDVVEKDTLRMTLSHDGALTPVARRVSRPSSTSKSSASMPAVVGSTRVSAPCSYPPTMTMRAPAKPRVAVGPCVKTLTAAPRRLYVVPDGCTVWHLGSMLAHVPSSFCVMQRLSAQMPTAGT